MAYSSLNRIRIKNMANNRDKRAILVYKLIEDYDNLLSTTLVGNNIVTIVAASLATVLFVRYYGDLGVTISTVLLTVLILLFGEIAPKSAAKKSPENVALLSAPVMRVLIVVMTPVNFLFKAWQRFIAKFFKGSADQGITEEELLTILEEAEKDGAINEEDSELIHSAIEFNDETVDDILTPRVDIIGASKDDSKEKISEIFAESGFSRIPVFEGSLDEIVGVINIKDFFNYSFKSVGKLSDIIKPVFYITPTMKISDLFKEFQKSKNHLAVVTDEYGGTLGIVTMEDILEELVGEIWDEHDEITEDFLKLDDGTYRIACGADVDELFEFFALTGEAESSTVSGWIMEQLGKIPDEGDSFDYENLTITVSKTDQRRVVECIVRVNPPA